MFLKKVKNINVLKRILVERFTEPLHINILSVFVFLFGSYSQKIFFDLVMRQHNAYCIEKAARDAASCGLKEITVIEFGVATGTGLMNMSKISAVLSKKYDITIHVVGFDTGGGLTTVDGYKDYSDRFQAGDYPMNVDLLKSKLDKNTTLILGDVKQTVSDFLSKATPENPIAYVVLDLDLYTSSRDALAIFLGDPKLYLPTVYMYVDDIDEFRHSTYCGEELAISEFNKDQQLRKIEPFTFIKTQRVCKNAKWLHKIFKVQIFDHPIFSTELTSKNKVIKNPFLS